MTKSKLEQEQEVPMANVTIRMTYAHERWMRKRGGAAFVRKLIEDDMRGFKERRTGPGDRRRSK